MILSQSLFTAFFLSIHSACSCVGARHSCHKMASSNRCMTSATTLVASDTRDQCYASCMLVASAEQSASSA